MARDIFKDGPSPGLQAHWDRLKELERQFYSIEDPIEREKFLETHLELATLVVCRECGQTLPEPSVRF